MRCEVIAVGTELVLGQLVDTNSAWIGEQLAQVGIDCYFQTRVDDDSNRLVDALRQALARSEAAIVCGGLGPTHDDLTRDALAAIMQTSLVRDESLVERIRSLFASRGREMPESNLRQADVPEGACVIAQMPGTAAGLICPVDNKPVYAVPGVPYEMREMLAGTVLPDLQRRAGVQAVIKSRTLRTWGRSESAVAELLAPRIAELAHAGNPRLAFQASGIEGIKVRITAKSADAATVEQRLAEEETRLRAVLGELVFGVDDETMESVVIEALRARGLTLAVAESLTGGLVGARLSAIPGASDVLRGVLVAYAGALKFELLGVPEGPVVSAAAAEAMALGARRLLQADVGLATTGVAGPAEQEGQPVGTVFLGVALGERALAHRVQLPGDRERIRQFAAISLLNLLRQSLGSGP